ncbi:Serine/threonine-protein kinase SRPK [Colletotrichum sp. SAR11_239]|nr:Serine/threonine-protein kinase SRPK [Colletotrichum sp. SAR11_239]
MKQLLQSFQAGARRLGARLVWSANMSQVPRPIDEEDLAGYRPGGYHSVRIGDHFNHGKYKVLNKLGYGGYSTVWLARNNETESHVALKVLAANTSEVGLDKNELDILLRLSSRSATNPGTAHVLSLLDHFEHRGPNGDHLCLVSKPMGPNMSVFRTLFPKAKIPVPTIKRVSKQLLLALSYLHDECQVIHTGDEDITESSEISVRLADFGTLDIWNLGLVIWELTQGAVLFDGSWTPQDPYTGEAQLAQMTSLLGAFPKSLLSRSRECDRYFASDGNLLKPSTFGSLSLDDMCKDRLNCNMSDSDRADFLDFIMAMIRVDPAERPDAKTLLGHKWIQEA